jgi:hypothetical protein
MNIVYIKSPTSSSSFATVREALRKNCDQVRAKFCEKTLDEFSEWYLKATKRELVEAFDLHIVECSLVDLPREIEEDYGGTEKPFLCDPAVWPKIIEKRAMGAVLHASLGQQVIVFLYEEGKVTDEIQKLLARCERMTVKKYTEVANLEFIESAAYRCDCGLSAVPIIPSFVLSPTEPKAVYVPRFISTIVTETFDTGRSLAGSSTSSPSASASIDSTPSFQIASRSSSLNAS